jgi:hypothetical protein
VLVDIFERIENCFKRLESYTELPPSEAMTDMTVKIIVEILSILAVVTTEIKQRRRSELIASDVVSLAEIGLEKYLNKLLGRNDVDDALKRLDKLTQEEARMTIAEVLKVSHKTHKALDGARCTISVIRAVLSLILSRTSHATDSKPEPVATRPSKVAVSPGLFNEPQHRP